MVGVWRLERGMRNEKERNVGDLVVRSMSHLVKKKTVIMAR